MWAAQGSKSGGGGTAFEPAASDPELAAVTAEWKISAQIKFE